MNLFTISKGMTIRSSVGEGKIIGIRILPIKYNLLNAVPIPELSICYLNMALIDLDNGHWIWGDQVREIMIQNKWIKL